MPADDEKSEKGVSPEMIEQVLSLINKRDRPTVRVLAIVIAIGVGTFSSYVLLNNRADAYVDARIEAKVKPTLEEHGKRLNAIEPDLKEMHDWVSEMYGAEVSRGSIVPRKRMVPLIAPVEEPR